MNGAASISQRTGGLRQPASREPRATAFTSSIGFAPRRGLNPMSCMNQNATMSVTPSIPARRMYGTPRSVSWAMTPPSTEPVSIAIPPTVCARPKTVSRSFVNPVAVSASTSHASVAPEKNVNPSPSTIDATAQPRNGALICHMTRYSKVDASSVTAPSMNENRRPRVSATTPVGTSNRTWPTAKNAFAANASVLFSPASSRNRVLMPQMNDAASVVSRVRTR